MADHWRAYQAWRTEMIEATRLGKLKPKAIADLLAGRRAEFPEYILDWEIAAYRRSPDSWRDVVLPARRT